MPFYLHKVYEKHYNFYKFGFNFSLRFFNKPLTLEGELTRAVNTKVTTRTYLAIYRY